MTNWEQKIVNAWQENAEPWDDLIRNKKISSRELLSNQAIVDAVVATKPKKVLDIGCGEGWLCRALCAQGVESWGCDVVAELIKRAEYKHSVELDSVSGSYQVVAYQQLLESYAGQKFDVCVCNFSLLGEGSTEQVIIACRSLLASGGKLIIQTLSPKNNSSTDSYQDGWREGSWAGLEPTTVQFKSAAPWYFRTLEAWLKMFEQYDYQLVKQYQPSHPQLPPSSIIFCLQLSQ